MSARELFRQWGVSQRCYEEVGTGLRGGRHRAMRRLAVIMGGGRVLAVITTCISEQLQGPQCAGVCCAMSTAVNCQNAKSMMQRRLS